MLYLGSKKIKDVFNGNIRIRRIYQGSTLVYVRPTISIFGNSGGQIEGSDFWSSAVRGISGTAKGKISYQQEYLKGVWDFHINTNRQKNTTNVTLSIKAYYNDGTNEQVFFKNDFPTPNNDNITDWHFKVNIPKNWVGYEITATSNGAGGTYNTFTVQVASTKRYEIDQNI